MLSFIISNDRYIWENSALPDNDQTIVIEAFNSTARYLDDLLIIDNLNVMLFVLLALTDMQM